MRASRREALAAYGLLSPWLVFVLLTVGPMVASAVLSFTDYDLLNFAATKGVGLENYREALTDDPVFWQSLRVTAYYALLAVALDPSPASVASPCRWSPPPSC
jgi:multiple sugar transport system permease protein